MSTFVQIHTLTSHPASLLNRGEDGLAKTMPFGGRTRTRISSQCLKYTWRTHQGPGSLRKIDETEMSVRSQQTFYHRVAKPLIEGHEADGNGEEEGLDPKLVYPATRNLQVDLLGEDLDDDSFSVEDAVEAAEEENTEYLHVNQVVVFGPPELRFMRSAVREEVEALSKSPEELESSDFRDYTTGEMAESIDAVAPAGLDAAMFGRMSTDESGDAQVDGAVHVKHALTVHPHQRESDYFITADDFRSQGGGHLNSKSLTSGLYYTNVVVDRDGLVDNLSGREDIASELIGRLIKVAATVTPGAKKSSTAPYSHAELLLVERGEKQPRTLANAFREALPPEAGVQQAQERLEDYLSGMDSMYGRPEERYVSGTQLPDPVPDAFGTRKTLDQIQDQV